MLIRYHVIGNKETKWRLMLTLVAVWQLVVFALFAGGNFGDIFEWLDIPWNTTGILNVIGTTAGWILLELPLMIVVACIWWRTRRGA
jgi:uncharacterized membrane protein YhdT